jgi:hypothetical protein
MAFDHGGAVAANLLKGSIAALSDISGVIPLPEIGLYVLVVGTKSFRDQSKLHSSVAAAEEYLEAMDLFSNAYRVPCALIQISGLTGIERLDRYVVPAN